MYKENKLKCVIRWVHLSHVLVHQCNRSGKKVVWRPEMTYNTHNHITWSQLKYSVSCDFCVVRAL